MHARILRLACAQFVFLYAYTHVFVETKVCWNSFLVPPNLGLMDMTKIKL